MLYMIIKLTMTDQYPAYLSGFYMMFLRREMLECTTHFVVSSAQPYMIYIIYIFIKLVSN
jgi:hypothetical protein